MFGSDDKAQAQATMAILQGMDVGIPPMQAIQSIAVINGRCTIWGDLVPALIWSNGHKIKEWMEGEGDTRVAHCLVTRGDNGQEVERTFSVEQAKVAGLWGKAGPWKQYPDRMLQMRARGFAARDGASDVMRGMQVREEIEEERPMRDITPAVQPPTPPAPPVPPTPSAVVSAYPDAFAAAKLLTFLDEELAHAHTFEELHECWLRFETDIEDRLTRNEREVATDTYQKHEARLKARDAA
jgi:hypothetical protein